MPTLHPPELPGLDYVSRLGAGGFADVYAYDQRVPRRRVAVKVLRASLGSGTAAAFLAEANAMAQLEHPHIATVHSAGIAPDGRPYLVMPVYSGSNLADKLRSGPLPVAEVLQIGVTVSGAVETAHRHGLLHRDIKPGNLLTDQYGRVVLADFGLAGSGYGTDEAGLSIPWSAPEVIFADASASVRSDVYSVAATLWTLLTGHSPYGAVARAGSEASALLARIRHEPIPPLGRADLPDGLETLLRAAIAKDPAERPASAMALARGLQDVQARAGLPVTDAAVAAPDPTRQNAPRTAITKASGLIEGAPSERGAGGGKVDVIPPPPTAIPSVEEPRPAGPAPAAPGAKRRWPVVLGLAVGLCVAVAVGLLFIGRDRPLQVTLSASRAGDRVTFSWTYPDARPGDTFVAEVANRRVARASAFLVVTSSAEVCARVQVLDSTGAARSSVSPQVCG